MKVLFISSQKKNTNISPFVKSQGDSLEKIGVEVSYFLIKNKGLFGYLKAIFQLKKFIKKNQFDVFHAHYSYSGYVASLAGCKPLVISLLGSDVLASKSRKIIMKVFIKFFNWPKIIVKSEEMKSILGLEKVEVIPNGVDMDFFKPMPVEICRVKIDWPLNEKIILFNGDENNSIKNYELAEEVVSKLPFEARIISLKNLTRDEVVLYYNACDVFLSTSKWEGSPNTIKEAMACNTPIIATKVGDISFLFGKNSGNYCCEFNSQLLSEKLQEFLLIDKRDSNKGRFRLNEINLDQMNIAQRIKDFYD